MKPGWPDHLTASPEDTIAAGEDFAGYVETGDIIALEGELASGKTTFMKGVARGLGYGGRVTSPTFTLINEYEGQFPIIHIDCYRESSLERWVRLGLNEYFRKPNIVFIEWAELIRPLLPDSVIEIEFNNSSVTERKIRIK